MKAHTPQVGAPDRSAGRPDFRRGRNEELSFDLELEAASAISTTFPMPSASTCAAAASCCTARSVASGADRRAAARPHRSLSPLATPGAWSGSPIRRGGRMPRILFAWTARKLRCARPADSRNPALVEADRCRDLNVPTEPSLLGEAGAPFVREGARAACAMRRRGHRDGARAAAARRRPAARLRAVGDPRPRSRTRPRRSMRDHPMGSHARAPSAACSPGSVRPGRAPRHPAVLVTRPPSADRLRLPGRRGGAARVLVPVDGSRATAALQAILGLGRGSGCPELHLLAVYEGNPARRGNGGDASGTACRAPAQAVRGRLRPAREALPAGRSRRSSTRAGSPVGSNPGPSRRSAAIRLPRRARRGVSQPRHGIDAAKVRAPSRPVLVVPKPRTERRRRSRPLGRNGTAPRQREARTRSPTGTAAPAEC